MYYIEGKCQDPCYNLALEDYIMETRKEGALSLIHIFLFLLEDFAGRQHEAVVCLVYVDDPNFDIL